MEPAPVTRKVRRTVRLAVALVVGQALLCALIGWLTLGRAQSEPSRPSGPVIDELAVPPLVEPVPPVSRNTVIPSTQARRPSSAPVRRGDSGRSATSAAPLRTTAPATRTPEPITAPPEAPGMVPPQPAPPATSPPATSPAASTTPVPTVTMPAPAVPTGELQRPVRVGDECRPEGAYGRTAAGELVQCVREGRSRSRWKIV